MDYVACNSNVVNEYSINGKIEWYCGFKCFYLCQISPLFSLCMYLLLSVFLTVLFNKKKKRGFIWPKTFDFLFQKPSNFYSENMICSLKVFFSKNIESIFFHKYRKKQLSIFVKYLKNKHEHELFHRSFSVFFFIF